MAKSSGLGDNLYLSGVDLSGDVGSVDKIGAPQALLDVTGLDKSAYERIGGHRDGTIDFTAFFNPAAAQAHLALSPLPRTDVHVMYMHGTTIGNPGAALVAKQVNYDPTRGADGSLTEKISCMGSGYGLEWGDQLTAGKRTDTTATNGATYDTTVASTLFGWQAYLQAFALTGTSCTPKIQDSADGSSWADLTGAAFTAFTTLGVQRLAGGSTATVRRYLRVVTAGTFTSATFAVLFVRNATATVF